eukprot:8446934-Alexandrium_andersonii.AAC.1
MGGDAPLRTFSELAGLALRDVSKLALSLLPGRLDEPLRRLTACTDGSSDPSSGEAAGAATLIGLTANGELVKLGWAAVAIRQTAGALPLADRPTNNSAELAAILLALRCLAGVRTQADFE